VRVAFGGSDLWWEWPLVGVTFGGSGLWWQWSFTTVMSFTCFTEYMFYCYYFVFSPGKTTCRISDELPWLLRQTQEKEALQQCLLNLCVFQRLYSR
jgi:hypothetical protein